MEIIIETIKPWAKTENKGIYDEERRSIGGLATNLQY